MTREDEDMIRFLCMRAATLMESAASTARWPHETKPELVEIVELMEQRTGSAARLLAAAIALVDE